MGEHLMRFNIRDPLGKPKATLEIFYCTKQFNVQFEWKSKVMPIIFRTTIIERQYFINLRFTTDTNYQ